MKKISLTILILFMTIGVFAQSWNNTGNALQRKIMPSTDTSYRFNLGSTGFMYFPTFPQLNTKLLVKANKDSTFNINKNFYDVQNKDTARHNLRIDSLLAGKADTSSLSVYALDADVLHKAQNLADVPNKQTGKINLGVLEYLGEWNSTQASSGYYNRPGCLVSYNNVLYRIVSNPGTIAPRNWDPSHYAVASNPIGLNTLKSMSVTSINRYDFLTMSNLSTQQLTFKFAILVSDALTVDSTAAIESQVYEFNLQRVFSITPNIWYQLDPTKYSTFNNSYGDTTSVKNRVVKIDFQYIPTNPANPIQSGTFKFRYRINNSLGLTGTINIRNYMVSNSDLLPMDNAYTGSDTPTLYMNQPIQLDKGMVIASPNGTQYKITVSNGGTLTVTAL